MPEAAALKRHACPGCGGDAQWNPSKQALVCPFCGTVVPGTPKSDGSGVVEHDLAEALRNVPDDQRGWNTQKTSVKCQSCQAISVFDPGRAAQTLRLLRLARHSAYEESRDPVRPESLLPFKLSEDNVRGQSSSVVWFALVRTEPAEEGRANRHAQGGLPALLDLRRGGSRRMDG